MTAAEEKMKHHLTRLKKAKWVEQVPRRIKELTPGVTWWEIKGGEEEEAALAYRMEGELGEHVHLSLLVVVESMETEEDWFLMYRTSLTMGAIGGFVKAGKHSVYSQAMNINRSILISFTTDEENAPEEVLEAVKVKEGRKLPGDEVEEMEEEYFFSPAFQRELLGFLTRMTLMYIPREDKEETLKELVQMTSGSEMLHYRVKKIKAEAENDSNS